MLIDEGSIQDTNSIHLATKENNWIKNVRRTEVPLVSMRERERIWTDIFKAQITNRSLSATYNCFGMVFASRRTVILDSIRKILREDGYNPITERLVKVGDIVTYRTSPENDLSHAGIVVEVKLDPGPAKRQIRVLSQWGFAGEYFHPVDLVPEVYGKYWEYWTDRRR